MATIYTKMCSELNILCDPNRQSITKRQINLFKLHDEFKLKKQTTYLENQN